MKKYDVIGDIHGHAVELGSLLEKLGYRRNVAGTYMPPEADRITVFTGDYIDRGGENFEVIRTVRDMVSAGHAHAIMGNHDLNAVLFHTLHPDSETGEMKPLRKHDLYHTRLHQTFIDELERDPESGEENLGWLKSLPICLERDGLRFVHAMWDQAALDHLRADGLLNADGTLHPDHWHELAMKGTPGCDAVDLLTKGQKIDLPPGVEFINADGHTRGEARLKWWADAGDAGLMLYQAVLGVPAEAMPDIPAPEVVKDRMRQLQDTRGTVVFFGHYWMSGEYPTVETERAICLDQSVAKDGYLAAATVTVEDGKVLEMSFHSVKARPAAR
ncbi:metallophosphoesterase [Luteolibacter yonseiensis]|uniref:Metallophosphoesterase n=1 Tax=Luteolibacter yonseiensis TaxID=1144680 RepID=A0A934R1D8_9BACT|nr:metallophosphoesterase [Luteolibacter yonseiensis]MBK1815141.1 metallophosphoesterase [Luteolibacter yonseiensis]